jgi:dolichol-phosphate mannosyltransferase
MTERGAASASLVLLSFDERHALERLLPRLPLSLFERVVAIDPGSTDGTLDIYRAAGIPVLLQARRGRGEAFRLAAEALDTELLVFLSTDGNEDPGDLPEILSRLRAGADLVVAGRFVRRGARTDTSDDPLRLRKAGAITFGLLARLLWRTGCWDGTNGYRGFRVAALRRLALDASGHDIEYQSTIRAAKLEMSRVEIATRELPRLGGKRKVSAGTWALGWCTLRCLLRELRIGRDFVRPVSANEERVA